MYKRYFFFLLLLPLMVSAQDEGLRMENYVYKENISTVIFHRTDSIISDPIVSLNSSVGLRLRFDDLDADNKEYLYTIVHCDRNWQPSDIDELDYIDGYTENDIQEYQFSYNTIAEFTHFRLDLPNEDIRWTKSGNYLLKVYEDEDEKTLALTRRFVVTEQVMNIEATFVRPANPAISSTHQELDLTINYPNLNIGNPQEEVTTMILQNGRWDNALTNLKPRFQRNNKLVYDYQGKIVFPGGKEFRHLDMRSYDFNAGRIHEIDEYSDHYEVLLHPDKSRTYRPYVYYFDLNGKYLIENLDVNVDFNQRERLDITESIPVSGNKAEEHALRSDYGMVRFSLKAVIPFMGKKVYLFGAFSDWQILPQYELTYNESSNSYEGQATLKQGYYNYSYALVDEEDPGKIDFEEVEGNWHETENDYTVLVYWRPFGQRYDRVAAAKNFNSVKK